VQSALLRALQLPSNEKSTLSAQYDLVAAVRVTNFLIDTIKRSKRQPIWIPSRNFPADPF
jgi:hypothetical protein